MNWDRFENTCVALWLTLAPMILGLIVGLIIGIRL